MKQKIIAFLSAFIISLSFISGSSLSVYANGGGGTSRPSSPTDTTGFNDWSLSDKAEFFWDNIRVFSAETIGFIVNEYQGGHQSADFIRNNIVYFWDDAFLKAKGCETYDDYIAKCLSMDDNGDIIVNNDLSGLMHDCAEKFIEEESGFFILKTFKFSHFNPTNFGKESDYHSLSTFFDSQEPSDVIWFHSGTMKQTFTSKGYSDDDYFCILYVFDSSVDFYEESGNENRNFYKMRASKDWVDISDTWKCYNFATKSMIDYDYKLTSNGYGLTTSKDGKWGYGKPFSRDGHTIRIYHSLADLKAYSLGQRPYFITDKFQDYNVNGDNSCIISDSNLQNSSVYGDVYNYIINNYGDNANGLSEDDLMRIVSELLAQNSGSSGSSSGGSSSGSSGGGLGNFLKGLGSIGDALLSILGKLLEYVGKAFELITGLIDDVLTIIPENITKLLTALFPFIPEEWVSCITLSLVLGVVGIIIGLFKK